MSIRICISKLIALSILATGLPLAALAAGPALQTLEPGAFREIPQGLDVNVVFVGFSGTTAVDTSAFKAAMPATYRSIHRYPNFYGQRQSTGNRFNFNYTVVNANATYADALFGYLSSAATAKPRTLFQEAYNAEAGRGARQNQRPLPSMPARNRPNAARKHAI